MVFRNPLSLIGMLDRCWMFIYRTPAEAAQRELSRWLEPVAHGGFGFWNVAICHVSDLRPVGALVHTGIHAWCIAYRLYTRLSLPDGTAPLEGTTCVRTDCDNLGLVAGGLLLRDLRFHLARVQVRHFADATEIRVHARSANAHVVIDRGAPPDGPMPGSPFGSLAEAAERLRPAPRILAVDPKRNRAHVVRIERDDAAWLERPVSVARAEFAFLRGRPVELETALALGPIEYRWYPTARYALV